MVNGVSDGVSPCIWANISVEYGCFLCLTGSTLRGPRIEFSVPVIISCAVWTDRRQSFAEVKVGSAGKMTRGHERELDGRDGEEVAAWVCGRCPELSLKYRGGKNLNEFTHRHQLRVTLKSQITRSAPIFCTNARTDPLGRGRERLLDVNPAEARRIIPLHFVIGSEAGAAGLTPRASARIQSSVLCLRARYIWERSASCCLHSSASSG
jgi:hypothetical protein